VITTVAFDADDTLVDIRTAVRAGLVAVSAGVGVPVEVLAADASAFWARIPERPAREIRIEALRHSLDRAGRIADLEWAVERFFEVRYANSFPFPEVSSTLDELRTRALRLGYATNANSRADRCGLAGRFDFEIYALEGGVPKKPHAAFFHAVLDRAGDEPASVVYVGDSHAHDVVGAAAVGIRTVWLNRKGAAPPDGVRPDAVIGSLKELPAALARL
jgi:putative hydrolase of the HAD superfamily